MKEKKSIILMAVSKGVASTEPAEVKRYYGIAPVFILGVNPTKAELSKIYGREVLEDPIYVGTTKVGPQDNQVEVPQIRLDFLVKTDDKCGIEMTNKITIYLAKSFRYNKDGSKVQVIDKYGRTAWPTVEEVKTHAIPQYSSGPAKIDADYRPCYIGEEDLTNLIINYLNIPGVERYNNETKSYVPSTNPEESEARLDKIEDYFTGDISELKEIINLQPNNKVKAMFGVKTTEENKQYETTYTHMFLKNHVSDYTRLFKEVEQSQASGAFKNVTFFSGPLKEYVVESSTFTPPTAAETPKSPWQ